eukprot:TRINITY_DN72235_c0_g1_i1.p1 TRINITY_DN72235_c0_g1~~TRINITY_DN72235_c0_g1_i1.p1  ORF type:complete len:440 (+),score=72.99 TRINITY_DN72235_c0_g1_i1:88-1407(+)
MDLTQDRNYGTRNNRELMGVHSDVLFADPLGVRAGQDAPSGDRGSRGLGTPGPLRSSSSRGAERPGDRGGGYGGDLAGFNRQPRDEQPPYSKQDRQQDAAGGHDELDIESRYPDDAENWGTVGNFFMSLVANGRQCCSMRDRTRKEDVEAAKRAAAYGRPPGRENQFPGPGSQRRSSPPPHEQPETPHAARQQNRRPAYEMPLSSDSESAGEEPPLVGLGNNGPRAGTSPAPLPRGLPDDRPSADKQKPVVPPREDPFLPGKALQEQSAPSSKPPGSAPVGPSSASPPAASATAPVLSSAKGDPTPPEGPLPSRWEWPPWCLNFKSPSIEVWVFDDDANIGRWVSAQPQSRVVDKTGRDAYLCAEYNWDGEFYVQDFGPQHVRKQGEKRSVLQQLTGGGVDMDSTKVFKKPGAGLDETKVFQGKKGKDNGGGLSSFLRD